MLKKIKKDKKELMRAIKDEVVALKKSPLYKYRIENKNLPVIGQGSHDAKVMFIGEAPGKNEAQTGFPFCGASGKILDELLAYIGMDREKVYITIIVKDRPPLNRDPSPEEIEIYGPFLDRQIEIIEPKVIIGLGRYSMEYVMRKFGLESKLEPISKLHGQVFETTLPYGKVKIIPLYHPAVAVYNSHTKDILKKDFEILKKL